MTRRATHLFHPENIREEQSRTSEKNSQEHQRRTVKNIREEQSRASEKNSQEHQRRTVKNTVRTSKLSRVETKRSRDKKSIFISKVILQN